MITQEASWLAGDRVVVRPTLCNGEFHGKTGIVLEDAIDDNSMLSVKLDDPSSRDVVQLLGDLGTHFQRLRIPRRSLFIGTPRSGTLYIARIMKACCIDIAHEQTGLDGVSAYQYAVCDDHPTCFDGPPRTMNSRFDVIFHQIRHPLKTIASMLTLKDKSFDFMAKHVPRRHSNMVVQCAAWYLAWNAICAAQADFTYCVEDVPAVWDTICHHIGVVVPMMPNVATDTHSRPHDSITLDDIRNPTIRDDLRQFMIRRGYFHGD